MSFRPADEATKRESVDTEDDEGEQFDFDSGDEVPEADRQAADAPPARSAGADAPSGSGGPPAATGTRGPATPSPHGQWDGHGGLGCPGVGLS